MDFRLTLTNATVKQLEAAVRCAFHCHDTGQIKRLSAIRLLADTIPVTTIAHYLLVSESSIYRWRDLFLAQGLAGLRISGHSPGRPAKLTKTQKQQLVTSIAAGPEAAGYATGCWTSAVVQAYIAREFGKHYSVGYVRELLRNLGLTYQKARFVSDHLDTDTRQTWLTQTWPQIVADARRRGASLWFGDEASFAQWGSLAYTWAVRGQQPVVKTTGIRKGYKLFGVVEYFTGQVYVQSCAARFTAATYQTFLHAFLAQTTQPVILIQDGARYHTAKDTQTFFAAHADRLTIYQLPGYSPDYNPIEHVWRTVKRQATHNRYFATFEARVTAVDTFITSLCTDPQRVTPILGTVIDAFVPALLTA